VAINLKAITSCIGYEQITSLSTATALNAPSTDANGLNCRPSFALISCEAAAVRWRDDGVVPTASVGMPLAAGVTLQYDGDISRVRFIQQTPGAKLNISYYA
jgi:hypothetical protein